MSILHAIRDALLLPPQLSEFERRYLTRMNRVGFGFFALHVPVFMLVAWFNGTGPLLALGLTLAVMAGPVVAYKALDNPRRISEVYGFTAMFMGGLLVHFGQGPVQIEMHFYFFALLAMLAIFGNPMVIVVAAVTVALHHLLLWAAAPISVFNYDAPVWVVVIHAAFVVLESVATVYIARSFFDNVIGLERIVQERTAQLDGRNRDMRLVLDNVEQGLVTVDADGSMSKERSAAIERWLGEIGDAPTFAAYLERSDPDFALAFELAFDQYVSDMLPADVAIDQLPSKLTLEGRHLGLAYTPITGADQRPQLLVMITDNTVAHERERLERDQRELMSIVDRVLTDRNGFVEFYEEATALVASIADDLVADLSALERAIHTLKGNTMLFGLHSVAEVCHALENTIEETHERPSEAQRAELMTVWNKLAHKLSGVISSSSGSVVVEPQRFSALLGAALGGAPSSRIAEMIAALRNEPTSTRLRRIGEQAQRLARRLGRGEIAVDCIDNGLGLDPRRWSDFWASFVHMVRNAVDHGLEEPEAREQAGKPRQGRLQLTTAIEGSTFVVSIHDDGRGIDWVAVAKRATAMGLPAATRADLEAALTSDGLSTAVAVTEFSGRGVGMGAVLAACRQHRGRMTVTSEPGEGATFSFRFPIDEYATNPREILAAA